MLDVTFADRPRPAHEPQQERLDALFAGGDHVEVEVTWAVYQRMIAAGQARPGEGAESPATLLGVSDPFVRFLGMSQSPPPVPSFGGKPRVRSGDSAAMESALEAALQRRVSVGSVLEVRVPPPAARGVELVSPTPLEDADRRDQHARRAQWLAERPGWTEAGWWESPLLPQVRALLWLDKGPHLLAALTDLGPVDTSWCAFPHPGQVDPIAGAALGQPGNPCGCQLVQVVAWATAAAWVSEHADAMLLAAAAPARQVQQRSTPGGRVRIVDMAIDELAVGLRRSPVSLRGRVDTLRTRNSGPASLRRAVEQGFLAGWQADFLLADVAGLSPADQDLVMDEVVHRLRRRHQRGLVGWSMTEIRQCGKRVSARLPAAAAAQRREAKRRRGVFVRHRDGSGTVTATLPGDIAQQVFARIDALATDLADPADPRTGDQRRADVFTDLILAPDCMGRPAAAPAGEVAVVINLATLLGDDDRAAEVPGAGPVPADVARQLAADRRWRAWLTDATGTVVATSARTYTPTAAVARLLRAREPHCRMPGCRATRTDIDHVIPWPIGDSLPHNLSALCRRHHNFKTHTGWTLRNDPQSATYTWTSPTGVTYTDEPDQPLGGP